MKLCPYCDQSHSYFFACQEAQTVSLVVLLAAKSGQDPLKLLKLLGGV